MLFNMSFKIIQVQFIFVSLCLLLDDSLAAEGQEMRIKQQFANSKGVTKDDPTFGANIARRTLVYKFKFSKSSAAPTLEPSGAPTQLPSAVPSSYVATSESVAKKTSVQVSVPQESTPEKQAAVNDVPQNLPLETHEKVNDAPAETTNLPVESQEQVIEEAKMNGSLFTTPMSSANELSPQGHHREEISSSNVISSSHTTPAMLLAMIVSAVSLLWHLRCH